MSPTENCLESGQIFFHQCRCQDEKVTQRRRRGLANSVGVSSVTFDFCFSISSLNIRLTWNQFQIFLLGGFTCKVGGCCNFDYILLPGNRYSYMIFWYPLKCDWITQWHNERCYHKEIRTITIVCLIFPLINFLRGRLGSPSRDTTMLRHVIITAFVCLFVCIAALLKELLTEQKMTGGAPEVHSDLIDIWHLTFDFWHLTSDIWHLIFDIQPMDQWTNGKMEKWTNMDQRTNGPMDHFLDCASKFPDF